MSRYPAAAKLTRRSLFLIGATLLFGAVLFPASAADPGSDLPPRRAVASPGLPVSSGPLHQRSKQVRRYWTPERMREARPADRALSGTPLVWGPPMSVAARDPQVVGPTAPADRRARGAGGGIPYARDRIEDPSAVPYRTHGKVFFTWKGDDYVCSGTVVTSPNESLVATAGHCVYDAGRFSKNFMFHPGFKSGESPFGGWTASELFTTSQWQNENYNFDVGMAVMKTRSGATIQDTVGARGIEFNRDPPGLVFEAFGYPAAGKFTGGRMFRCTSEFGSRDGAGPNAPLAIGCDMTGGSSGGGWVIEEANVNSVVSYGYDGRPEVLFGPYFGDVIETLYTTAGAAEPEPEPERVDHEIALTLNLKRHLRAKGRMTVPDGYLPCRRGAPIRIFRKTGPSSRVFVKSTRTGNDGRFSVRLRDRQGRYYAFGPEGEVDAFNNCLAATSSVDRHRHQPR